MSWHWCPEVLTPHLIPRERKALWVLHPTTSNRPPRTACRTGQGHFFGGERYPTHGKEVNSGPSREPRVLKCLAENGKFDFFVMTLQMSCGAGRVKEVMSYWEVSPLIGMWTLSSFSERFWLGTWHLKASSFLFCWFETSEEITRYHFGCLPLFMLSRFGTNHSRMASSLGSSSHVSWILMAGIKMEC